MTANNLVQNGSFEDGYEATTQTNGGWPSNHGFWAPIGYFGATDTIPDWTVSGGGADWSDSNRASQLDGRRGRRSFRRPEQLLWQRTGCDLADDRDDTRGFVHPELRLLRSPLLPLLLWAEAYAGERRECSTVVSADPLAEGYLDGTNIWHAASVSFTASSSSTVISFESLENNGTCAGPLVDKVSVLPQPPSAQPEPALDQSQTVGGWSAGGLDQWQSFTAGKTGLLTQLDLSVGSGLADESQAGVLRIYAGRGPAGRSWRPRR